MSRGVLVWFCQLRVNNCYGWIFLMVKSRAVFSLYPCRPSMCISNIPPFPWSFAMRFQMKMKKQQKRNIWLPYLSFIFTWCSLLSLRPSNPLFFLGFYSLPVSCWPLASQMVWRSLLSVSSSIYLLKSGVAARDYSGGDGSHLKCLTGDSLCEAKESVAQGPSVRTFYSIWAFVKIITVATGELVLLSRFQAPLNLLVWGCICFSGF